jgi:hypothetical protein
MRALRVHLGPRDKRGDDPLRLRHQATAPTREIPHILRHGLGIEQHQIGHGAFGQPAAVGNADEGKTIREIAALEGKRPVDACLDLTLCLLACPLLGCTAQASR